MLQGSGPVALHFNDVALYDENLDDCQDCLALYDDLVRTDPEMAIGLTDLLASEPGVVGYPHAIETIHYISESNTNAN